MKLGSIIKIKKNIEGEELDLIYKDTISDDAAVKLALLLPFRAKLFDTISPEDIFKDGEELK